MPTFDTISEWVLENLYLVGAVTAVVLLAVLLILLMASRRRHRTEGGDADFLTQSAPQVEIDLTTPLGGGESSDDAPAAADSAPASDAPPAAAPARTPDSPPENPAVRPSKARPGPAMHSRLGTNHARDIVQGMLEGRGELTAQELRRIELMRPEQILSAVAELEPTLKGKGKEPQRTRLAKVRQHAELLLPTEAGPVPAQEEKPVAVLDHHEPAAPAPAEPEIAAPEAPAAEDAYAMPVRRSMFARRTPPIVGAASETGNGADARVGAAPRGGATPEPLVPLASRGDDAPEQTAVVDTGPGSEGAAGERVTYPFQPAPEPVFQPVDEPVYEAVFEPTAEPEPTPILEPSPEPAASLESELGRVQEATKETWTGWDPVPEGETWEIEGPDDGAGAWILADAEAPEETSPVEEPPATAEAVLALSEEQRPAALSTLDVSELGRLFELADDKALRLSVIDALDLAPTAETMLVLQSFLDDPDPEVQLRALEAAERLLEHL